MTIRTRLWSRVPFTAIANGQTIRPDTGAIIIGLLAAYGTAVVMMALTRHLPSILTVPFIVLSLSFVPGVLVLLALAEDTLVVEAEHVLYAFGASLFVLMLTGALVNILLPFGGVESPLMPVPLAAGVTAAVGVLAVVAYRRPPAGSVIVQIPPLWSPAPLGLLLVPLLSIIGVILINATGLNLLLVVVLIAVAAVPLVAVSWLQDRWHGLAIWSVALALLYHKSLWQHAGFGGRPHGIAAWEAGRWSPGIASIEPYSSELLQNGVLFPMVARLSDLFIMTQFGVVNPFFISFIPVAMYVTFRQYVRTDMAFLGAAMFAFVHPFYLQYPTAGRAATPVLFLALFAVTLSNHGLSPERRGVLSVVFLMGVVITHYGTSYYVAGGLLIGLLLLYTLWTIEAAVWNGVRRTETRSDGGAAAVDRPMVAQRASIFSAATVSFFISAALGWYLYTRQGWKFDLLPKHVYENVLALIGGPTVEGRTAARVLETYTAPSIQISKQIYILLALLTAFGFFVIYYRRLVTPERCFDDHYLTISTALFGIFGSTIILNNWGGGRPMMITFSFTTVFAVVGVVWIAIHTRRALTVLGGQFSGLPESLRGLGSRAWSGYAIGTRGFAVLLMILLVLNTGVAAGTVFDGLAPSNVPAQSRLTTIDSPQSQVTVHRETDIVTHVWVVGHLDARYPVYADTFGARQFDWYRPDVAARTPPIGGGYTSQTKPEVFSVSAQRGGTEPGYVLIMGHNLELGTVWPGKFSPGAELEELALDRRNRIYTTGESQVYFYADVANTGINVSEDEPAGD